MGGRRPKKKSGSKTSATQRQEFKPANLNSATFEKYYKAQRIVPEDKFEELMVQFRQPLPTTFRINRLTGFAPLVRQRLANDEFGLASFKEKGGSVHDPEVNEEKETPFSGLCEVEWACRGKAGMGEGMVWSCNVPRRMLKRIPEMKAFRDFLITENENGSINRQEAVSMIPPLLLDVQPHHLVADMCAAPGSKTAQLLEKLHCSDDGSFVLSPSGCVWANDADNRRAQMLTHQLQRLECENWMVVNHEGQCMPNFRSVELPARTATPVATERPTISDENAGTGTVSGIGVVQQVDRVLCDVPCSGDGTMRKNVDVWGKWGPHFGNGLHIIQARIAFRGFEMLKVGGLLVYSTCSLNPVENEAVVVQLLKQSKGAVELVDVSDKLPGLVRDPGLTTWKVFDHDMTEYSSWSEVGYRRRKKVRPSFFPPTAEEVSDMHLEHCMRLLPTHQDTGGFFVAVLRKTGELPAEWSSSNPFAGMERQARIDAGEDPDSEKEKFRERDEARDKERAKAAKAEQERKTRDSSKPKSKKQLEKEKRKEEKEAEYHYSHVDTLNPSIIECIRFTYGLSDDFPTERLFTRGDKRNIRRVYYLPVSAATTLIRPEGHRLKCIFAGVRLFERVKGSDKTTRSYRVCNSGSHLVAPYMTRQLVYAPVQDVLNLLRKKALKPTEISDELFGKLQKQGFGSVVLALPEGKYDAFTDRNISIAATYFRAGLKLMVKEHEIKGLVRMLETLAEMSAATSSSAQPDQDQDQDQEPPKKKARTESDHTSSTSDS